MRRFGAVRAAVALLVTACSASCARVVSTATTTPASWSYVEEAWGGLALVSPTVASGTVSLPLETGIHPPKRFDSAICVCGASARTDGARIVVLLESCVCGPGSKRTLLVQMSKPTPGVYSVHYDDAAAGFPKIGELVVE